MNDIFRDDCITVRLRYTPGGRDKLTSVFIKREGRDPTEAEVKKEEDRMHAALDECIELTRKRLLEETGMTPEFGDVYKALIEQMEDPKHHSDYTPYHRWNQGPVWPTTRKYLLPTSKFDPVDLTESSLVTITSTKKHRTNLRQTNAGALRSSPPLSKHLRSLSIVSQPKPESVPEQTPTQPTELSPKVRPQTDPTTMPGAGRRKVKAVPKGTATSTPTPRDVELRPTTEAVAKSTTNTTTETSSQPVTKQHAEKITIAGRAMHSKSSPPPASTRIEYNRPLFVRTKPKTAPTTDKPRISGPTFVRKQPDASLLTDEHEQLDSTPKVNDKSLFKTPQPHPGSASSQQPARAPISEQASNDGVTTVSASQCKPCCPLFNAESLSKNRLGTL